APLLLLDGRINGSVPAFEDALKTLNREYALHMYDDVNHAFHNDTNAARDNQQAAASRHH
ncbi:MAG: dienelactone hydrolase family protein, partial [Candidatus Latescibacteria bacterium]|nr:dienelactone hydrolase family protein [Candidatus Latescibacterota bacterium]